MFVIDEPTYKSFMQTIEKSKLSNELSERMSREVLTNGDISVHTLADTTGNHQIAVTCTYKVAAEIGRLGDNTSFLRDQVRSDAVLHLMVDVPHL